MFSTVSSIKRDLSLAVRCTVAAVALLVGGRTVNAQGSAQPARPRLVVLTDIENEPDDSQSMVRLLTYANVLDIEGLVATTSTHLRTRVAPGAIREIIDAYAKVHANLLKHDAAFPPARQLRAMVKAGVPRYGMQGVGAGNDSEGSEWIIHALERTDARPLWIAVWGGPNTLAQALWKIRETKPAADAERLYRRLRVYTISDQDDSGPWIRTTFPSVFYIVTPGSYSRSTWTGINSSFPRANNEVISNRWIAQNIQQGHGPLGAAYPDVAWGMEGDTPSFLGLIPNGLNVPEHPDWGGWGGRYELYVPPPAPLSETLALPGETSIPVAESRPIWTNAEDAFSPIVMPALGRAARLDTAVVRGNKETLWRWREDFQNDFAARMNWSVRTFSEANHPPVPRLTHPDALTVRSGETFTLDASATTDPDGDSMSYFWFQYPEAGSYKGPIDFGPLPTPVNAQNMRTLSSVRAPPVDRPQTAHIILRVTDKGTPALSRYKRVIITIVPTPAQRQRSPPGG